MKAILEENKRRIDQRLEAGLALLRETYQVEACPVDPQLSDPVIGGRPHHARRYDIQGVGNLLAMTVKEAEANQLSSFVLMPYAKNLPLFSTDYVYAGEKRFFLLEIYDLSVRHDAAFDAGIDAFRQFGDRISALPDFPTRSAWYDSIRPVCWAKTYGPEQDDFVLEQFLAFLKLFVSMEQAAQNLTGDELVEKWKKNKAYADQLIGVGIHIYNEDIYPLQSFEIYLRNCGLGGPLDLSGFADLLFVDLYHNEIAAIDVSGDASLRILGVQDNQIQSLDVRSLKACQGIDAGKNRLSALDVSQNAELVELYINDNDFASIDLSKNQKLKYFYCHNNHITLLDTTANPLLRHLDATGNPMKQIRSLAPQRDERLPLELTAEGPGTIGLKFNPVYNAQWKETGEWQQAYFAYPEPGAVFTGWYDPAGTLLSRDPVWQDAYGSSRILTARFAL